MTCTRKAVLHLTLNFRRETWTQSLSGTDLNFPKPLATLNPIPLHPSAKKPVAFFLLGVSTLCRTREIFRRVQVSLGCSPKP